MLEVLKSRFKKRQRILHKNIGFLLNKNSLDIKSLSAATNIPMATIVRMKKEENNPTISTIEPIADFFRVDIDDLLYEDLSGEQYQNKQKVGNVRYISVINLDDIREWPLNFDKNVVIGTVGSLNEGSFGISVDSDSLMPVFYKNSILIVDSGVKPKDGDYVFCLIEKNSIPVLRQIFIDGNNHFIKPINPNYGGMISAKKLNIVGVVIKSIENYR